MDGLLLALNQNEIKNKYKFKLTNINIYSFEEALYYFYNNWKYCLDDIFSDEFINWVKDDLELEYLSKNISKLKSLNNLKEQIIGFLTLEEYFNNSEIEIIKDKINIWINQEKWLKLKEQGDFLYKQKNYNEAIRIYLNGLKINESIYLYNNIGLSYGKLGNFKSSTHYLNIAYELDNNHEDIIFNLAEASILNKEYKFAVKLIEKIKSPEDKYYLMARVEEEDKHFQLAIDYYTKAYEINNNENYIYYIVNLQNILKKYENSLELLLKIENKTPEYYLVIAEVYYQLNNTSRAILLIDDGLGKYNSSIKLWINLARYYRKNKDYVYAERTIKKALEIDKNNPEANFENAKINREKGNIKDYQKILTNILEIFKTKYREDYT